MNKTLLIIGAGVEACEGIEIAQQMGLKLIIADGNPEAPGFTMAHHRLVVSTYDAEAIALQAWELVQKGISIDGVISMCADVPISVATVAQKLALPGLSMESAQLVADKLLMKQRLQQKGIAIPRFKAVASTTDLIVFAEETGLPFIIKPVDSRGARGVQLLDKIEQFESAFLFAQKESPTGRVMVEEYLEGPQISTETLIEDGRCYTLGFADRNYEWLPLTKPYMIENGGDSPSALDPAQRLDVIQTVEKAALALGITSGVAKGDMVLTSNGAKVIEIAGRLSGGYFSTTHIPLNCGVNFIQQALRLALGEKLDAKELVPKQNCGVAIRYLNLKPGLVKSITGIEDAQQSEGVEMLSIYIQKGDSVLGLQNHTQRTGFVMTKAETKNQAIQLAVAALSKIRVQYDD
ncbi:MAG: hypothetical protein COW84_03480 [Gammaproteobacteria bacterium CG22_combo_CG10-13_8_21_14_all_40_8]|nr:MAG: hypothetical protein COW84_03480 [Gammaproteobacteria bacterium CG22_combo_CG10-13_8_21_14_all_40_8]